MTFAAFMEAALYDEGEGFYASHDVGPEGHFVTSPHVSPAFGILLTRQLGDAWETLGRPDPFTVVEAGAGDGTLARRVLETAAAVPPLSAALAYVCVERSAGVRRALEALGLAAHARLGDVGPFVGCVVANELLDNLPFHILRERGGGIVEVKVGVRRGRFTWVEDEPTREAVDALRAPLRPGESRPVSPAALAFVRDVASRLTRGYAFLFDYGFGAGGRSLPLRAYRAHRVLSDVLERPGTRDITAGADFAALAAEARGAGLQVWGPVTQRDALLALGIDEWLSAIRVRQVEAERTGEGRDALRLYDERTRASMLVDPAQLGSLALLALGTEGLPPPVSVAPRP